MFEQLRVQQFRSYMDRTITLSPGVTIISGPNGSGKTNLLEALYVAAKGASFRVGDADLLQFGQSWWRIDVAGETTHRTVRYDPQKATGKKQFELDSVKRHRLTHTQKLPVVLFEPEDLRLLSGSPARRRAFIDTFISQLEPGYAPLLGRYERALRQRNNVLKKPTATDDELFVWDVSLGDYGAKIIELRQRYVAMLRERLVASYRSIAETDDEVTVLYPHYETSADVRQSLHAGLHAARARDQMLGFTSVGPHRHDLAFVMNDNNASVAASRGETRSIVLALKLLELEILQASHQTPPLLLLDDVFSELDSARRAALVGLGSRVQTVITTTDADIGQSLSVVQRIIL